MTFKAVDAVPAELQKKFISAAYKRGKFWGDMFELCSAFGLRNVEARELRVEHVNLKKGIVTLSDSKQVRSHITKAANKAIDKAWLIEGRKYLRSAIGGELAPLLVRMAIDTKQLEALADEYDLTDDYRRAKDAHYHANIEQARIDAAKSAPKGRIIDFSKFTKAKRILEKRIALYGELGGYLFPRCELNANRAQGFEPVSRQAVYKTVQAVREALESISLSVCEALKGIRLGLHSCRKTAVQKVANAIDMMAASLWIGHGNGSGDIATTQKYLDRSEKRINEINERLAHLEG